MQGRACHGAAANAARTKFERNVQVHVQHPVEPIINLAVVDNESPRLVFADRTNDILAARLETLFGNRTGNWVLASAAAKSWLSDSANLLSAGVEVSPHPRSSAIDGGMLEVS